MCWSRPADFNPLILTTSTPKRGSKHLPFSNRVLLSKNLTSPGAPSLPGRSGTPSLMRSENYSRGGSPIHLPTIGRSRGLPSRDIPSPLSKNPSPRSPLPWPPSLSPPPSLPPTNPSLSVRPPSSTLRQFCRRSPHRKTHPRCCDLKHRRKQKGTEQKKKF